LYIWTFSVLLCLAIITGVSSIIASPKALPGVFIAAGLTALYAVTLTLMVRKHRLVLHLVRLCTVVFFAGGILGLRRSILNEYPMLVTIAFAIIIVVSIVYFVLAGRTIHVQKDSS
jgi:hypothetical protein